MYNSLQSSTQQISVPVQLEVSNFITTVDETTVAALLGSFIIDQVQNCMALFTLIIHIRKRTSLIILNSHKIMKSMCNICSSSKWQCTAQTLEQPTTGEAKIGNLNICYHTSRREFWPPQLPNRQS